MIKLTSHPGTSGLRSGRRRYIRVCIYIYILYVGDKLPAVITRHNVTTTEASRNYRYRRLYLNIFAVQVPKKRDIRTCIYIQACKSTMKNVLSFPKRRTKTTTLKRARAPARRRCCCMLLNR